MAFEAKFTASYGATDRGEVAVAVGSSEAQSDTISVNMDVTNMGKAEAIHVLGKIADKIQSEPWPPVA